MSTFEKLVELLGDVNEKYNEITPETLITEELHMDSLDCFEMIVEIEDMFGISFPEESYEEIETISDLVTLIESCE